MFFKFKTAYRSHLNVVLALYLKLLLQNICQIFVKLAIVKNKSFLFNPHFQFFNLEIPNHDF